MSMINVVFRASADDVAIMKAETAKLAKKKPWRRSYTVSDFIRDCVSERLDHLRRTGEANKRSQGRTIKQQPAPDGDIEVPDPNELKTSSTAA